MLHARSGKNKVTCKLQACQVHVGIGPSAETGQDHLRTQHLNHLRTQMGLGWGGGVGMG